MPPRNDIDLIGTADIPAEIHTEELATLLGLSVRHVDMLAKRGVFHKTAPARFDARQAISAYAAYARKGGNADLDAEALRLKREQADKLAIQNAAARRELLPAVEVQRAWTETARDLRAAILAIPARVAANLGLSRASAVDLDAEIRLALEALADGPQTAAHKDEDLI